MPENLVKCRCGWSAEVKKGTGAVEFVEVHEYGNGRVAARYEFAQGIHGRTRLTAGRCSGNNWEPHFIVASDHKVKWE
jgi:hypothetical protein